MPIYPLEDDQSLGMRPSGLPAGYAATPDPLKIEIETVGEPPNGDAVPSTVMRRVRADPPLGEVSTAAFALENPVQAGWQRLTEEKNFGPYDPEHNPFAEVVRDNPELHEFAGSFIGSANLKHSQVIANRIRDELKNRKIIEDAGWYGTGMSVVASILSPTNLLPGGAIYRVGKIGTNVVKGVASVGAANAVASGIDEAVLQSNQYTRTALESGLNIGGSFILGGILGGAASGISSKRFIAMSRALDKELNVGPVIDDAIAARTGAGVGAARLDEVAIGGGGQGGVGAQAVRTPDLELVSAGGLERILAFATPTMRTANATDPVTREIGAQLVEPTLAYTRNADGFSTAPRGGSVETRYKTQGIAREGAAVQGVREFWAQHRFGDPKAKVPGLRAMLDRGSGKLTEKNFRIEVGKAMRRGDTHDIPEVAAAAKHVRKVLVDPLADAAIKYKLLDPEVVAKGRPKGGGAAGGTPSPKGPDGDGPKPDPAMVEQATDLVKQFERVSGTRFDARTRKAAIDIVTSDNDMMRQVRSMLGIVEGPKLTPDAHALLKSVDDGGVPAMMTNNLKRIAEENGIKVESSDTPNVVIDKLKRLRDEADGDDIPFAALDGALSARMRQEAGDVFSRLDAGETVDMPTGHVEGHYAKLGAAIAALPDGGAKVGVISKIKPLDGGLIEVSVTRADGSSFTFAKPLFKEDIANTRAFHESTSGFIVFSRLYDIGEVSSNVLRGELRHEYVHGLWRSIDVGVRDRLVGHANNLRVMDVDARDYFDLVESPYAGVGEDGASLHNVYKGYYSRRFSDYKPLTERLVDVKQEIVDAENISKFLDDTPADRVIADELETSVRANLAEERDIMDRLTRIQTRLDGMLAEEQVAHMVEMREHGMLTDRDLEPVLDDIKAAMGIDYRAETWDAQARPMSAIDAATGQAMRRDLDQLGYYSHALEVARGLKQAKGTPEQMLAMLKKGGVKDAEITATRLDELFGSSDRRDSGAVIDPAAQEGKSVATIEPEVWGPKFQKLMSGEYSKAVAGGDLSTQLDILTAKYFNGNVDSPQLKVTIGAEIERLRRELGPEWMAKYAPDAKPIQLALPSVDRTSGSASRSGNVNQITKAQIISHLEENRVGLKEVARERDQKSSVVAKRLEDWRDEQRETALFEKARTPDFDDIGDKIFERANRFLKDEGIDVDAHPAPTFEEAYEALGVKLTAGRVGVFDDTNGLWYFVEAPNGRTVVLSEFKGFNERYPTRKDAIADLEREAKPLADDAIRDGEDDARISIEESVGARDATKWSGHSLDEKNDTYRETVLHLPGGQLTFDEFAAKARAAGHEPTQEMYQAALNDAWHKKSTADFSSGHFPEPNIVGHLQSSLNKLTAADTKRMGIKPKDGDQAVVYNLDQVQSDAGQLLREQGVRDEAKIAELKELVYEAMGRENAIVDRATSDIIDNVGMDRQYELTRTKETIENWLRVNGRSEEAELLRAARADYRLRQAELDTAEASPNFGNPLKSMVGTTDQWVNITLRRAIRQAAEADADAIAIPSGKTVLSYNPGDEAGMEAFYNQIVPKNLRNLLQRLDKSAGDGEKVERLVVPTPQPRDQVRPDSAATRSIQAEWDANVAEMNRLAPGGLTHRLTGADQARYQTLQARQDALHDQAVDETVASGRGQNLKGSGFTVFRLTPAVKRAVLEDGQPMFALGGGRSGKPEDIPRPPKSKFSGASFSDLLGAARDAGVDSAIVPGWKDSDVFTGSLTDFELRRLRSLPNNEKIARIDAILGQLAKDRFYVEAVSDDFTWRKYEGGEFKAAGEIVPDDVGDRLTALQFDSKGNRTLPVAKLNALFDRHWVKQFSDGDPMFALGNKPPEQPARPDPASIASRIMEAVEPYLSASRAAETAGLGVERDAAGQIASVVRDGKRYAITRDADGNVAGISETPMDGPRDMAVSRDATGAASGLDDGAVIRAQEMQIAAREALNGILGGAAKAFGLKGLNPARIDELSGQIIEAAQRALTDGGSPEAAVSRSVSEAVDPIGAVRTRIMSALAGDGSGRQSVLSIIRSMGGIKYDEAADLISMFDKPGKKGHPPGLIAKKGSGRGATFNDLRERLIEEGWFHEAPGAESRLDHNSVLNLIDSEVRNRKASTNEGFDRDRILYDLYRYHEDNGGIHYDLTDAEEARFLKHVKAGMSIEDASERVAMETRHEIDERAARGQHRTGARNTGQTAGGPRQGNDGSNRGQAGSVGESGDPVANLQAKRLARELQARAKERIEAESGGTGGFSKEIGDEVWDDGGQSYLMRLYNRVKIIAKRAEFTKIITDYFAEAQMRAGHVLRRLEKEAAQSGAEPNAAMAKDIEDLRHFTGLDRQELADSAESVIRHILGIPDGRLMFDLPAAVRGPLKARTLRIPDALIEDFLESDINVIARAMTRTMSPDIELVRMFGSVGMEEPFAKMKDGYTKLMLAAPDEATRAKLQTELEGRLTDVDGMASRIRGTYKLPDDPMAWSVRAVKLVKVENYTSKLGGMVISAISDPFRVMMTHGVTSYFRDGVTPLLQGLRGMKLAGDELRVMGTALDMTLASRTHSIGDVLDDYARYSAFERGVGWVQDKFTFATLMPQYNTMLKTWSGTIIMTNTIRRAIKVAEGRASKKEIEQLAGAGIEAGDARIIAEQFQKHGGIVNGVYLPDTAKWDVSDANVLAAMDSFKGAVVRDVDRTIVTPGQDKPLMASTNLGSMVFQFKSFGISSMERTLIAGLQQRDAGVLLGGVMMVGMGAVAEYLKALTNKKELPKNNAQWIATSVDRSGLLGWLPELNHIAEQASGGQFGVAALTGKELSRYASRNFADSALGPTGGMMKDLFGATSGISRSIMGKERLRQSDIAALRRIIPFNNVFYWSYLFQSLEESAGQALGAQPATRKPTPGR